MSRQLVRGNNPGPWHKPLLRRAVRRCAAIGRRRRAAVGRGRRRAIRGRLRRRLVMVMVVHRLRGRLRFRGRGRGRRRGRRERLAGLRGVQALGVQILNSGIAARTALRLGGHVMVVHVVLHRRGRRAAIGCGRCAAIGRGRGAAVRGGAGSIRRRLGARGCDPATRRQGGDGESENRDLTQGLNSFLSGASARSLPDRPHNEISVGKVWTENKPVAKPLQFRLTLLPNGCIYPHLCTGHA